MAFTDLFADASPQERAFFDANYATLPLIDLCRRLRKAEWNEKYGKEEIERLRKEVAKLEAELQPPDCSTPPAGFELPKAAVELLDCAEQHGWLSLNQWGERSGGDPMVSIQLAHRAADGATWKFNLLTWVASGTSMVRSGRGLQSIPGRPSWHDAMSLKRIRELMAANPA